MPVESYDDVELWWLRQRQEKNAQRQELLAKNPSLRLTLDEPKKAALRGIINYVAFKVVRDSSVARDEAIKGSDFDGGLVVTNKKVSAQKRLEFIGRLREFGYRASDISEYRRAENQLKNAQLKNAPREEIDTAIHQYYETEFSLIKFMSIRQIKRQLKAGGPIGATVRARYYGKDIG